jgi:hypothetical protein
MSAERTAIEGSSERGARELVAAGAVAIALALYWTHGIPRAQGMGWDESMNAGLPSARMLVSLKHGDLRGAFAVLLGCSQYPFVYPAFLTAVQGLFGLGEPVCRAATTVLWCATLFGIFLVAREVDDRGLSPWLAAAFAALSPMALAFAGTLFLEVPFACASVFALRAWLRRRHRPGVRREVAAGAWIAACLFTKWNYGLLLAAGLGLDWILEAIEAARAGNGSAFAKRSLALAAVPVFLLLWWFVLPLPGSLDAGAAHRHDLAAYLALNREMPRVPFSQRLFDASTWLALTPRLFAVIALASFATLSELRRREIRTLWLVLACLAGPALAHPFHLDRFLIPQAVPFWILAGCGLARILPRAGVLRPALLAGLAALAILFPARGALRTAELLGQLKDVPAVRSYQEREYARRVDLTPARPLPTGGLPRAELDTIFEIVERETTPTERIGWFGVSSKLSPGVVHLGLLERGGSEERFLRDAARPMDVGYFGADPGWSDDELRAFASGFDVVFATEPPDLNRNGARSWTRAYRERLVASLGWRSRIVGSLRVARPPADSVELSILACRPSR